MKSIVGIVAKRAGWAGWVLMVLGCGATSTPTEETSANAEEAELALATGNLRVECRTSSTSPTGVPIQTSPMAYLAAKAVQGIAGLPANPNTKVSRADIAKYWENNPVRGVDAERLKGKWNTLFLGVDLGGEGHFTYDGMESGDCRSININAQDTTSQFQTEPIPALVKVRNFNDGYPLANRFASYVMMQGAPLTDANIYEIYRILRYRHNAQLDLVDGKWTRAQIEKFRNVMHCVRSGFVETPNPPYTRFICTKDSDDEGRR